METQHCTMSDISDPTAISGGDYVETSFGLMMGLAYTAGVIGSGGLLAAAFGVGICLLGYEELREH